ncbi:hypothetical protein PL8927_140114 [Planktothrix serta PCC 8927]|uniref:Uncharacterized protein n=2 Tax=Planktothrix TaxID=54304 RepID=A0A7Z9DW27_9CYAN|nr:hypothetical protein PL8927_140114 [Planktothrix serta PCC 8927]
MKTDSSIKEYSCYKDKFDSIISQKKINIDRNPENTDAPDKAVWLKISNYKGKKIPTYSFDYQKVKVRDVELRLKNQIENSLKNFSIENENQKSVVEFLKENKILISLLDESLLKIKEIFNESIQELCLDLHEDPEEDIITLFLIVKTNLLPKDGLSRLKRLKNDWLLDKVPPEILSIFSVTIESV